MDADGTHPIQEKNNTGEDRDKRTNDSVAKSQKKKNLGKSAAQCQKIIKVTKRNQADVNIRKKNRWMTLYYF